MSSSSERCSAAAVGSLLALTLGLAASASAAVDLAALQVSPQRGQSPDQARRDRYECHSWAVEQVGSVPLAAPQAEVADAAEKESQRAARAERWSRVLAGAAIGASVGGLIGAAQDHHHYPDDEVLAGAAVGAVIGAATGRPKREPAGEEPESNDYVRALTACLEGRGYTVALPAAPSGDEEADTSASSPRPPVARAVVASAAASAASTSG